MNVKETQYLELVAMAQDIPIKITQIGKTLQYSVTIPQYNPHSFIYDKDLAETYLVCLTAFLKF